MPRRHLPQVFWSALASAALVLLGPACLAVDDQSSTPASRTAPQSDDALAAINVDKLELPEPGTEGLLCVTLSSDGERTLDEVAVVAADEAGDPLHTFSRLHVTDGGMKSCTTTCLCYGPEPPPLDVVVRDDDAERRIASDKSAPTGCCEPK